jgi:hypothetical protein
MSKIVSPAQIDTETTEPTVVFDVTARIEKCWRISIPTAVIRRLCDEYRQANNISPYRPLYAETILNLVREQGGEWSEYIPDREPWNEFAVIPFQVFGSALLAVEEEWHAKNDD